MVVDFKKNRMEHVLFNQNKNMDKMVLVTHPRDKKNKNIRDLFDNLKIDEKKVILY